MDETTFLRLERPPAVGVAEARLRGAELRARHPWLRDTGYRSFGGYLRERFRARVFKVTLHAGFTCPNRDGRCGTGGCIYCVNESFSPSTRDPAVPVDEQMRRGIEFYRTRYGAQKFVAYFQTFTNTYDEVPALRKRYDAALGAGEDIVGLSVGTRPDCVPDEVLDLLESYSDRYEVWVEYGLQSARDETLRRINRGHGVDAFLDAVERTRGRALHVCAHIILGLPGENWTEMMETAELLAGTDLLESLKIHHLYVASGTALEAEYRAGQVPVLRWRDYVTLVADVLERIAPTVTLQRVVGDTTSPLLVAPVWEISKGQVGREIGEELRRRGTCQGARWRGSAPGGALCHDVRAGSPCDDSRCPR